MAGGAPAPPWRSWGNTHTNLLLPSIVLGLLVSMLVVVNGGDDVENIHGGRAATGRGMEANGLVATPDFRFALQRGVAWATAGDGAGDASRAGGGSLDAAFPTVLPDLPEPAEVEAGEPEPYTGALESIRVELQAPLELDDVGIRREGGIESLICSYEWNCPTALAIVQCESSGNASATNGISWGLWQIHAATWASFFPAFWDTWMIPEASTEMAWVIYKRAGSFSPWVCW